MLVLQQLPLSPLPLPLPLPLLLLLLMPLLLLLLTPLYTSSKYRAAANASPLLPKVGGRFQISAILAATDNCWEWCGSTGACDHCRTTGDIRNTFRRGGCCWLLTAVAVLLLVLIVLLLTHAPPSSARH